MLISVNTKKAEARKKHTREWPEAVNGENSGDQANVSVKHTRGHVPLTSPWNKSLQLALWFCWLNRMLDKINGNDFICY